MKQIRDVEQPLVSVIILTYNHENYIGQALDGVLVQKVNFPYEIIVSNDCSTDRTAEVIDDYVSKVEGVKELTNERIRVYHHKQNMGLTKNHCWTVKQAKGKYIAYCDGDDYWIDEYKLQRQIDYMESHPTCSMCYHNVIVETEANKYPFISLMKPKGFIGIEEIVSRWAIPTSAVVYRRDMIEGQEEIVIKYPNEDYAVEIFMKSKGDCYYDSVISAVYRRHAASVSAGMNANAMRMHENIIRLLEDAKHWFPEENHRCFEEAIDSYRLINAKLQRNIKYPFLMYFKKNTYKRWLLSILN